MSFINCLKRCFTSKSEDVDANTAPSKEHNSDDEKTSSPDYISFDDFTKLDLRAGEIREAELIKGSDKLIKCTVDFGNMGTRTIVSGIAKHRSPEDLLGNKYLYVLNLEPRKIFGVESQGMLVALSGDDSFAMLTPDSDIEAGAKAG